MRISDWISACALPIFGRLLALRLVDVGEHDLRALGGEALGAAVADARRRPGDHDDLVFHAHGLGSFCFKMFPLPSAGEGCEALVRSKIEPTRSWVRELLDRKSVGEGKSVSVRVDFGGRRI